MHNIGIKPNNFMSDCKYFMNTSQFNSTILLLLIAVVSCTSVKEVNFKTPVDTSTKQIVFQQKKVYSTSNNVYAANNFDGARLNDFQQENDSTFLAYIEPENTPINNSGYYSFKIWSKQEKNIYIKFKYPKGYKHRYIPKLKKNNTNWSSIDSSLVYKKDTLVSIKLFVSKDTTWVSAQEIVTSKDTENWYKDVVNNKSYVHVKSAGKSIQGRNLPVLDIYKGKKEQKPIVVLLTRQHPPEVTGFFAYQEFIETILKENSITNEFLHKYRILAFPIVNPDGVDLGHWRHNAGGVDTNRDWSKYRQPEINKVTQFIAKELKRNKTKIVLGLDFHSTYHDVFYTNKIRKGTTLPNFIDDWFSALEKNIPNYKVNEAAGNSTKPVSKGWFLYGHNAVGITYEIGDATPRNQIKLVGKVTAEEMMKILNNSIIN